MDFRKAFFPTQEEIEAQERFLKQLQDETCQFWKSKGLTDEQFERLTVLEENETAQLHSVQSWSSRKSLLESNIITFDKVLADINATT